MERKEECGVEYKNNLDLFSLDELADMIPYPVKVIEIIIMLSTFLYQGILIWQVARDFLAVNNMWLAVFFSIMALTLILSVDYLVLTCMINLARLTKWSFGVMVSISIVLSSVFIMEIGRLNVAQNGIPLASQMMENFTNSIDSGVRGIEKSMLGSYERWQKDINVLDAASEAEEDGVRRPEIEDQIRRRYQIDFRFSGKKGDSSVASKIHNIRGQVQKDYDHFLIAYKDNNDMLSEVKRKMVLLSATPLSPANYNEFVEEQSSIISSLKSIGLKYNVNGENFNIPPSESLFTVAVSSAFTLTPRNLVLWLLAFGTGFVGFMIALFLNAIVISSKMRNERFRSEVISLAEKEAEKYIVRQKEILEGVERRLEGIEDEIYGKKQDAARLVTEAKRKNQEADRMYQEALRRQEQIEKELDAARKKAEEIKDEASREAQLLLDNARSRFPKTDLTKN